MGKLFVEIIGKLTIFVQKKKMSTFVSRVNLVSGQSEWVFKPDNYDYVQEIARSAYADMLHDHERNILYEMALKRAIDAMHARGRSANVLDIGTGTGLLSMMAVRHGADSVTACEAFKPVADCARQVIKQNGMELKIHLIPKRSTEVTVGRGGDMLYKANILVTEVFDTELIGEGAISTFRHALANLLESDCMVVPSVSNMYAQVVHSDLVLRWNKILPVSCTPTPPSRHPSRGSEPNTPTSPAPTSPVKGPASPRVLVHHNGDQSGESNGEENGECDANMIYPPEEVVNCPGAASVHDLQLDQLSKDQFTPLSKPTCVFKFDFTGRSPLEFKREQRVPLVAENSGTAHGVFMWWELEMDADREILLSCAPHWAHPTPHDMPWRDHWMQAIYYPAHQLRLSRDEPFVLHCCHDEYSLWFDVTTPSSENNNVAVAASACRCGVHVACSHTRLGMINDRSRTAKYVRVLDKVINEDTVCLCLSDSSLLPLIAAKMNPKKVYTLENHSNSRSFLEKFKQKNNMEDKIQVIHKKLDALTEEDFCGEKITLLLAEPYFSMSSLPWHDLFVWYARTTIVQRLVERPTVLPQGATMRAIAVQFDHLWKIRAPVGNCEGFNISHFDKVIGEAADKADDYMEPQPLWEYPGRPMSDAFSLMAFDFTKPLKGVRTIKREGFEDIWTFGSVNGIAVWLDYQLDSTTWQSQGLTQTPHVNLPLQWYPHARQAVHLFPAPCDVTTDDNNMRWRVKYKVVFKPSEGDFKFDFQVVSKQVKPKEQSVKSEG